MLPVFTPSQHAFRFQAAKRFLQPRPCISCSERRHYPLVIVRECPQSGTGQGPLVGDRGRVSTSYCCLRDSCQQDRQCAGAREEVNLVLVGEGEVAKEQQGGGCGRVLTRRSNVEHLQGTEGSFYFPIKSFKDDDDETRVVATNQAVPDKLSSSTTRNQEGGFQS